MRNPFGYAALAALLCMTAGCGGNKASSDTSASSEPSASASTSTPAAPAAPELKLETVSKYDSGPRAFEGAVDEAAAKRGEQLFKDKGCSACHAFGKKVTCPDLAGVVRQRTAEWIENQILHPEIMVKTDPIAHDLFAKFMLQMPNQKLTPEQAKDVIAFFRHKEHEAGEASK
jgi:mono/diheme cytochrome c family protein